MNGGLKTEIIMNVLLLKTDKIKFWYCIFLEKIKIEFVWSYNEEDY